MILSPAFGAALSWAAALHAEQRRKASGTPYVGHLLAVAAIVLQYGGDEQQAIAAVLHDAVEDQGGTATLAEIERRFGARVAQLVLACSDATVAPKPPWRQRKEAHVAHIRAADDAVRLIVAADKLDNARSLLDEYRRLGEDLWRHFRGGRAGTLWYYRAMLEALSAPATTASSDASAARAALLRLVAEAERVVGELERLASPLAQKDACQ